jgi:tetratricopeptide (TPR) repeat protein
MIDSTIQQVKQLREQGNVLFKSRKFQDASSKYSSAILLFSKASSSSWSSYFNFPPSKTVTTTDHIFDPVDALAHLLSNRSLCNFKLFKLDAAKTDAEEASKLLPDLFKPYYRIGEVSFHQHDFTAALQSYKEALKCKNIPSQDHQLLTSKVSRCEASIRDSASDLLIIQLSPGFQICRGGSWNPITSQLHSFAINMQNFIYILVNTRLKECILVDAAWDIGKGFQNIKR